MKNKFSKISGSNQLRWVILLLAVAMILPTVCLLWFMIQAAENEKLAFRQRLIDIYEKKAITLFVEHGDRLWHNLQQNIIDANNIPSAMLCQTLKSLKSRAPIDACLVYDSNGMLIYPVITETHSPEAELFEHPWQMEFLKNTFADAQKEYAKIAAVTKIQSLRYSANMAIARCLIKQDKQAEAKLIYHNIAYPDVNSVLEDQSLIYIIRARVMLVELYAKTGDAKLSSCLSQSLADLTSTNPNNVFFALPSELRVWALTQLIKTSDDADLSKELALHLEKAKRIISSEEIALRIVDFHTSTNSLENWPTATLRKILGCNCIYGIHFNITNRTILCLFTRDTLASLFVESIKDIEQTSANCGIHDNTGELAICSKKLGTLLKSLPMGNYMAGWDVSVYFEDPTYMLNTPIKRAARYIWAGSLVVGLIIFTGITAIQVVGKQMKLNRLKNDFIATVTHELKTPLASMRVLVDTLLEGNYNDQQTASEYLQLISKENLRLSRLIDNFLTFSRMERNKQAFDFAKTSPAEIAKSAAEAVKTKFNSKNCKFIVTIADNLASIMADKDAMVTVLVNLLDNAYKYSYNDKHIELSVSSQDSYICFSVKDNGIGMTRRQIKRVFDRFYQADSSLSRQAEGTGLGLSIVKFIVDAHKGKIEVESKLTKGSEFKIILTKI